MKGQEYSAVSELDSDNLARKCQLDEKIKNPWRDCVWGASLRCCCDGALICLVWNAGLEHIWDYGIFLSVNICKDDADYPCGGEIASVVPVCMSVCECVCVCVSVCLCVSVWLFVQELEVKPSPLCLVFLSFCSVVEVRCDAEEAGKESCTEWVSSPTLNSAVSPLSLWPARGSRNQPVSTSVSLHTPAAEREKETEGEKERERGSEW